MKRYAALTYDIECQFCATPFRARRNQLLSGHTKSCGCWNNAQRAKHGFKKGYDAAITHGLSKTREYRVWASMWQRIANPSNKDYHYYGGRGITIHPDWARFENFIADMGPRPSDSFSIDRINNNEGYEMLNCRWATKEQQMNNTRRAHNG